jgi:hypothetical protein
MMTQSHLLSRPHVTEENLMSEDENVLIQNVPLYAILFDSS